MDTCGSATQPLRRGAHAERLGTPNAAGEQLRVKVRVERLEGPQAQELADRQLAVIARLLRRAAEAAGGKQS